MKVLHRGTFVCAVLAMGLVRSAGAQEEENRRELERRARELRQELRELERRIAATRRSTWFGPNVVTIVSNRAQLGVFVRTAADEELDAIGAELESVTAGGPAEEAGLRAGDIIISYDGERLPGRYPPAGPGESEPAIKLIDLVRDGEPGDEVTVEYRRNGETQSTIVTLGGPERSFSGSTIQIGPGRVFSNPGVRITGSPRIDDIIVSITGGWWWNVELVELNEDLGRYFGTSEGLLVIRPPEDEEIDLRSGDVILTIDGRDPRTPARAMRILRSYEEGETVNLDVLRDGNRMTVSVEVPERDFGWEGRWREF